MSWSQRSHSWLPELGHSKSIYTVEIGEHYKSELFSPKSCFTIKPVPPERQILASPHCTFRLIRVYTVSVFKAKA